MSSTDTKDLESKVVVIRLNAGNTEMKAGDQRVFKRRINLNFDPVGMIIRQIHSDSLSTTGISIYQSITHEEIGIIGGGLMACPSTFIKFNTKFINNIYDFVLMDSYIAESSILPSINTTFASQITLVIEFVKYK